MKLISQQSFIFFDGVCNLCNSTVQFIIKKDTKNIFSFASLQSDAARNILLQYPEESFELNSIILISSHKVYLKSSAVLRIFWKLGKGYKLLFAFWIVPKPIRDVVYDYIAKNRYKWFGKSETCMLPNEDLKKRFLE
jgi:predicted DCC family thiol-disulfide oxidoreductase YuxK